MISDILFNKVLFKAHPVVFMLTILISLFWTIGHLFNTNDHTQEMKPTGEMHVFVMNEPERKDTCIVKQLPDPSLNEL